MCTRFVFDERYLMRWLVLQLGLFGFLVHQGQSQDVTSRMLYKRNGMRGSTENLGRLTSVIPEDCVTSCLQSSGCVALSNGNDDTACELFVADSEGRVSFTSVEGWTSIAIYGMNFQYLKKSVMVAGCDSCDFLRLYPTFCKPIWRHVKSMCHRSTTNWFFYCVLYKSIIPALIHVTQCVVDILYGFTFYPDAFL